MIRCLHWLNVFLELDDASSGLPASLPAKTYQIPVCSNSISLHNTGFIDNIKRLRTGIGAPGKMPSPCVRATMVHTHPFKRIIKKETGNPPGFE